MNRIRHQTSSHRGYEILETLDALIRAKKGERDLSYAPGRIYANSRGLMEENTEGQTRWICGTVDCMKTRSDRGKVILLRDSLPGVCFTWKDGDYA